MKSLVKNKIAKDLFTPKYKPKTELKKKGKGSFSRSRRSVEMKSLLKSGFKNGEFYSPLLLGGQDDLLYRNKRISISSLG